MFFNKNEYHKTLIWWLHLIIKKLLNKYAETAVEAFRDIISSAFYEFNQHKQIAEITGAGFYFTRPYVSSVVFAKLRMAA